MLTAAGVPFEPAESSVDEDELKARLRADGCDARALASALAQAKALAARAGPDDLVLGSDQTLETDSGGMLDKPARPQDARDQLRHLSGRTHRLHSAAVIVQGGQVAWKEIETVHLHMRPLSNAFIDHYVEREFEAIRWSVGGYLIEGAGIQLFAGVEGSHFAILGMPLLPLLEYLRSRKVLPS